MRDLSINLPTESHISGTPFRWRHLTPEQREFISNGCGGKGSPIPVPDFIFTASCSIHDFNYWLGGSEKDRKKADLQFYNAMLIDVKEASWYKRPWYKLVAWTYYRAVRYFAKSYFYYAEAPRSIKDLELALKFKR